MDADGPLFRVHLRVPLFSHQPRAGVASTYPEVHPAHDSARQRERERERERERDEYGHSEGARGTDRRRRTITSLHRAPALCGPRLFEGGLVMHRRSWWLLSCTEAPPVPFRRVLPSLLAVPSLACSVASLSLCPGGYLPDQHSLQSRGLAGCQIAWDASATWSEKHTLELQLLHLQAHCDRPRSAFATVSL